MDVVIQPGKKQVAVSIREMDSMIVCERIFGSAQESTYHKISDRLI